MLQRNGHLGSKHGSNRPYSSFMQPVNLLFLILAEKSTDLFPALDCINAPELNALG